eukprot:1161687-Pelagomonas_calceolata.AAC.2
MSKDPLIGVDEREQASFLSSHPCLICKQSASTKAKHVYLSTCTRLTRVFGEPGGRIRGSQELQHTSVFPRKDEAGFVTGLFVACGFDCGAMLHADNLHAANDASMPSKIGEYDFWNILDEFLMGCACFELR